MNYSSQYASLQKGDKLLVRFSEQLDGPSYDAVALGRAQQTGKKDSQGVPRWQIRIAWEWSTGKRQIEVVDCSRIFFGGRGARRGTALWKREPAASPPSLVDYDSSSPTAAIQDITASITPNKKESKAFSLSSTDETVKRVWARKKAPERTAELKQNIAGEDGGDKESEQRKRSIHDSRRPKRPLPSGTRVEVFADGRLVDVGKVVTDKAGFLDVVCKKKRCVRQPTPFVSVRFYDKDTNEFIGELAELSGTKPLMRTPTNSSRSP